MIRARLRYRLIVFTWSTLILSSQLGAQGHNTKPPAFLVEQLNHDLFQTREVAAHQLTRRATAGVTEDARLVEEALREGLQHQSVEVRLTARQLLDKIALAKRDQQLARLMNPRCVATTISISGWHRFSNLAGDDMDARRFFSKFSEKHQDTLAILDRRGWKKEPSKKFLDLDPWRLSADDASGWALLLLWEVESYDRRAGQSSSRLGTALSSAPMGPRLSIPTDARVLNRLIEHWLRAHETHSLRESLLIAMRYRCHAIAREICAKILDERSSPASTEVTALLAAAALGRSDIENQAKDRLNDSRTAHVWQLIASRRVKIRTQVRDVAMAVLLHQRGIDPREAGYRDLQADQTLLFRDHSLGFPDSKTRQASQVASRKLLATSEGAEAAVQWPFFLSGTDSELSPPRD